MTKLAILVGNSAYKNLHALPCCERDVEAVADLIGTTGRFDSVRRIINADGDDLKQQLRDILDGVQGIDELFYYFSGHGFQNEADFYYCTPHFDPKRPNETGLSRVELHSLLRPSDIPLIVKVVDACHSGHGLFKGEDSYPKVDKGAFKNIIQIASCLNEQFSLTGDPLSEFTAKFCEAAVRKPEGTIYYSDVINAIRDAYLDNEARTPHFTSQSTGREIFAEDSRRLDPFRELLNTKWAAESGLENELPEELEPPARARSLLEAIRAAEDKIVTPAKMKATISNVFDGVISGLKQDEFAEMYDLQVVEHSSYLENATRGFIIRTLSRTERPDNFVTAEIIRTKKKRRATWDLGIAAAMYGYDDDDYNETWDLQLNCKLDRAQIKISLLPKFTRLQKLTLIVTAAPSLNACYFFELLLRQKRTDFDEFEADGFEAVKKPWVLQWDSATDGLVEGVCDRLLGTVKAHVEEIAGKL